MKKILVIISFLITLPVFAGGVGYINYEKVAANYNFSRNSVIEIEAKAREIETFLKNKEVEFSKLETPLQKKKFQESVQAELKTKEEAFNKFRMKREEDVYNRIHAVAEKIRLEKGYDVYYDSIQNIMDKLEREHFGRLPREESIKEDVLSCDLHIQCILAEAASSTFIAHSPAGIAAQHVFILHLVTVGLHPPEEFIKTDD